VHGYPFFREKPRRGGFSHAEGTGEAENEHAIPIANGVRQFTPPAIRPAGNIAEVP
jgi:hypothetical protein